MKYAWIKKHRDRWPVRRMCRVLKTSPSGYYDWLKRPLSARALAHQKLDSEILRLFKLHKCRYGPKRIYDALIVSGFTCSLHRVRCRMKKLNLVALAVVKYKQTTDSTHKQPVAANILNRDFSTTHINQKWVSDITYIPTREGWLYLAMILDLHSRSVIGWAMGPRIDRHLVCQALLMALWNRKFPKGVILHSDRGSQYCSKDYQQLLATHQLVCSMSRKGNCWDNAVAESFFKTLKSELIRQETYETRGRAKQEIFEYIETYYNRIRSHSALGYKTPFEIEKEAGRVA